MIHEACGHRCEHDGGVMRGVCVLCGGGGGGHLTCSTGVADACHTHNP